MPNGKESNQATMKLAFNQSSWIIPGYDWLKSRDNDEKGASGDAS